MAKGPGELIKTKLFFIPVIIAIFTTLSILPRTAFAYSSSDIPVRHWSYDSVEKLAMAGLLSISGLDTKPMTRIQMAYRIKEAMDNIEAGDLPSHLCFDRDHIEYLQGILYKLINEFRQELVLIGATVAQNKVEENPSPSDKFFNYDPGLPIETEHRLVSVKARKDVLLENENGLRIERGYNLRVRASPRANLFNLFTFSARPAFRLTETGYELFFDEAAAKFSIFNTEIAAEKSAMWWGPGYHGSMLLSNNAKPLNMVRVRNVNPFQFPGVFKNLGFFGFNFFVSKLEKDRPIEKPTFAGLRLEWAPLPYLSLGASRTAIMNGKGRPKPHLKDYIKIFFARGKDEFSSAASEAKACDSDQLASMDLRFVMPLKPEVRVASGLEIYGEWSGEDRFSFWENESPGFLMGLFLTDLLRNKGADFRVEYAKNKPGWYNHGFYNAGGTGTAYTYKGEVIGHHMGGDADDLFFRISKDLPFLATPFFNSVTAGGQLDFETHGLSQDTREKLTEFVADILWSNGEKVAFLLRYEFEYYRNAGYVSGKTARNNILLAEVNLKF